jgi:hypothetical protein
VRGNGNEHIRTGVDTVSLNGFSPLGQYLDAKPRVFAGKIERAPNADGVTTLASLDAVAEPDPPVPDTGLRVPARFRGLLSEGRGSAWCVGSVCS